MGMGEKRDIYFAILNKNPIAVTLRGWGANLTGSLVEVIGVDQGNETEILERASFEGMTRKLIIPTGHYLIFRLGIHTTEVEGAFDGYVYVETSYHTFKVCMCAFNKVSLIVEFIFFLPKKGVKKQVLLLHWVAQWRAVQKL